MIESRKLLESTRVLLLPIPPDKEGQVVKEIRQFLKDQGIKEKDQPGFIKWRFEEWRKDGRINNIFKEVVEKSLRVSDPVFGEKYAERYFSIHSALASLPFLSFDSATIFLSHLRLISLLATIERMSAAKITKVLQTIDMRLEVISWRDTQTVLRKMDALPEIALKDANEIYQYDVEFSQILFADASLEDSCFLVGQAGDSLGFSGNLEEILLKLMDEESAIIPYLQILHHQCLVSAFYDHALTVAYEFSPRGRVATWLFNKWENLVHTGNPILNNAKSVDVLDRNWANSKKKKEFEKAVLLADLLQGIDEMGFSASHELAAWIRRHLVRYIEQKSTIPTILAPIETKSEIADLCRWVASGNTETLGIVEQRFVDAIASLSYFGKNWRARGLGDSVNTNNLSRKKLGDCDFQNPQNFQIKAFEAHGGELTDVYYQNHLRTFIRTLVFRADELEGINDPKNWQIELIFIAHKVSMEQPESFENFDFTIKVKLFSFDDYLRELGDISTGWIETFNNLFIAPLNSNRTPEQVREKVRNILLKRGN